MVLMLAPVLRLIARREAPSTSHLRTSIRAAVLNLLMHYMLQDASALSPIFLHISNLSLDGSNLCQGVFKNGLKLLQRFQNLPPSWFESINPLLQVSDPLLVVLQSRNSHQAPLPTRAAAPALARSLRRSGESFAARAFPALLARWLAAAWSI